MNAPGTPLAHWSDVTQRDRVLFRLYIDLEDLLDATGSEVDASWYTWATSMVNDLRAYLIGKGFVI
jgi:hypothetical protein